MTCVLGICGCLTLFAASADAANTVAYKDRLWVQDIWDWAMSFWCDEGVAWLLPQKADVRLGIEPGAIEFTGFPYTAVTPGGRRSERSAVYERGFRALTGADGAGLSVRTIAVLQAWASATQLVSRLDAMRAASQSVRSVDPAVHALANLQHVPLVLAATCMD